jgi:hypothetical protein
MASICGHNFHPNFSWFAREISSGQNPASGAPARPSERGHWGFRRGVSAQMAKPSPRPPPCDRMDSPALTPLTTTLARQRDQPHQLRKERHPREDHQPSAPGRNHTARTPPRRATTHGSSNNKEAARPPAALALVPAARNAHHRASPAPEETKTVPYGHSLYLPTPTAPAGPTHADDLAHRYSPGTPRTARAGLTAARVLAKGRPAADSPTRATLTEGRQRPTAAPAIRSPHPPVAPPPPKLRRHTPAEAGETAKP